MLPVGVTTIIDIDGTHKLLYTPTMMYPEVIYDFRVVYQCMRTSIFNAEKAGVKQLLLTAFGGLTGGLELGAIARLMKLGYKDAYSKVDKLDWEYAEKLLRKFTNI